METECKIGTRDEKGSKKPGPIGGGFNGISEPDDGGEKISKIGGIDGKKKVSNDPHDGGSEPDEGITEPDDGGGGR
jgi:hypothetical protein